MKCGGTISDYSPENTGVRQGCVLAPTHCTSCMDHVLGRMSEMSGCGMSCITSRIIDLDLADDAVIFAETTENPAGGTRFAVRGSRAANRDSCIKIKVQAGGVPSQCGCGDALFYRLHQYLT